MPAGQGGGEPLVLRYAGRTLAIEDVTTLVIGRDPGCDLVLDHPTVSRRHATLARRGEILEVADLGSQNGVFVNGARVAEPMPVGAGARIHVGSELLVVVR